MDRKVNALFYQGTLSPAGYERWLRDNAVAYVALPDAPLDYSAAAEAALLRQGLPGLREVWHDRHWRVFAVRNPTALVEGARLLSLGPDQIVLQARHRGKLLVRVRFSPYWRLAEGRGCVSRSRQWTSVTLRAGGRVRLAMSFSASRIGRNSPRCD
jgi:hypothetical protein